MLSQVALHRHSAKSRGAVGALSFADFCALVSDLERSGKFSGVSVARPISSPARRGPKSPGRGYAREDARGAADLAASVPELIEAKAAFDRFDLDRSGKISLLELRGALKASERALPAPIARTPLVALTPNPCAPALKVLGVEADGAQSRAIRDEHDRDGSGTLDLVEFARLLKQAAYVIDLLTSSTYLLHQVTYLIK